MASGGASCAKFTVATPVIAGDIAFVETSLACGGLCGSGLLYALERVDGRWKLLAVARLWNS